MKRFLKYASRPSLVLAAGVLLAGVAFVSTKEYAAKESSGALAVAPQAMCATQSAQNSTVYFVSCGGFF